MRKIFLPHRFPIDENDLKRKKKKWMICGGVLHFLDLIVFFHVIVVVVWHCCAAYRVKMSVVVLHPVLKPIFVFQKIKSDFNLFAANRIHPGNPFSWWFHIFKFFAQGKPKCPSCLFWPSYDIASHSKLFGSKYKCTYKNPTHLYYYSILFCFGFVFFAKFYLILDEMRLYTAVSVSPFL